MEDETIPCPKPQEMCVKQDYRRSNQDLLRDYQIEIKFLSRGCVISIGCKSIPFESVETAMKELNDYVNNTYEVQEKWRTLLN